MHCMVDFGEAEFEITVNNQLQMAVYGVNNAGHATRPTVPPHIINMLVPPFLLVVLIL